MSGEEQHIQTAIREVSRALYFICVKTVMLSHRRGFSMCMKTLFTSSIALYHPHR